MRYPVDKKGVALPIQEVGYEPVVYMRRLTNRHHLQFNRADYMISPLHRVFRGLCNRVIDMRIVDHTDLHKRFKPPLMPTTVQMIDYVEEYLSTYGAIECVREKNTHEAYEVDLDNWNYIKRSPSRVLLNDGIDMVRMIGQPDVL